MRINVHSTVDDAHRPRLMGSSKQDQYINASFVDVSSTYCTITSRDLYTCLEVRYVYNIKYQHLICTSPHENLSSCCNLPSPSLHDYYCDHPFSPSHDTGLQQRKCFVVTQAPLDNTVLDFWKMAKDLESRTIVLLCDLTEDGKVYTQKYF